MTTTVRQTYFKPKPAPWDPADYTEDVVYAVRALHRGGANDVQQKLVWEWLMHLTGDDDWPFRPESLGGQRATDIALGKQFVGRQLRKMLSPMVTPQPQMLPAHALQAHAKTKTSRPKKPRTRL